MRVLTESYNRATTTEDINVTWTKNGITQTVTVRLTHTRTTRIIYHPEFQGLPKDGAEGVSYTEDYIVLAPGAVNEAKYYFRSGITSTSTSYKRRPEGQKRFDQVVTYEYISTTARVRP